MLEARIFPGDRAAQTGRFREPSIDSVANLRYVPGDEAPVPYLYHEHARSAAAGGGSAAAPQSASDVPLAIVAHGNAELMNESQAQFLHDYFLEFAVDVVVWEYAGYGVRANEPPSQESIASDARRVADFFRKRKVSPPVARPSAVRRH